MPAGTTHQATFWADARTVQNKQRFGICEAPNLARVHTRRRAVDERPEGALPLFRGPTVGVTAPMFANPAKNPCCRPTRISYHRALPRHDRRDSSDRSAIGQTLPPSHHAIRAKLGLTVSS